MRKWLAIAMAAVMTLGMGLASAADSIPNEGKAVFDFQDRAFFTVNMHSEEKVLLELDCAYQNNVANEYGVEFDSFFNFKGTCDTFYSKGYLFLEADKDLYLYEIDEDGEVSPVDAEYVTGYTTVRGGRKADGYLIQTKTLGNYGLALEEIA